MWAIRDDVGQVAQNWPIFTFDVSLPVKDMEAYVAEMKARLTDRYPDHTAMIFGHLGDGNLHVVAGVGDDSLEARRGVEACVYEPLRSRGGSVSAEHGVGLEKLPYLGFTRSPEEIATMRAIKQALDPKGILNPGKIFETQPLKSAAE
jgi:FAD/FMN-containing dehydrogenase